MSDAAPPPWVRRLRKRENGVDAGLKVLLITAWGYGPYNRTGPEEPDPAALIGAQHPRMPARPVTLWACVETLAEESGQPEGTVKDQLRRAIARGWIRRDKGSRMTLAWRAPGCFEYGTRTAGRPDRTVDQPDGGPTCPDGSPTAADGGPAAARTVGRPQTFHELPIELPTNVVEARDPHDPERSQCAKSAQHERERGTPKPSSVVPPVDPWPARVREASGSAHYHLAMSDGPAPSYGGLLTQAVANYGAERVLLVLRAWEADEQGHGIRPPGNKLWWRSWAPWVESVLGITAPKPEAATKRSPNGQAALDAVMAKVQARRLEVVS